MEFWVKLIEVNGIENDEAADDLQRNCRHVAGDYWLFEGDEEALHEGITFHIVGEEAIECYGDMDKLQLKNMVSEVYNVDKVFLR